MKNNILMIAILLSLMGHVVFISVQRYKSVQIHKRVETQEKKRVYNVVKIKPTIVRQLVQTSESENKEALEKSFLGEKNNTFDRQTVARVVDKFRESKVSGNSEKIQKENQQSKKAIKGAKALTNLGMGLPFYAGKKVGIEKESTDSDQEFMKEISSMSSANNDYVKDIPLADVTRFNTVEYRHFGFYQRIRNQLELHWGSSLKDKAKKIYKSGRKIATDSDFITNIEVILDKSGTITGINIIGTSGVKELDDAAIESFNKAGPFPNPPKDLISNNGTAIIKWGFVVKS